VMSSNATTRSSSKHKVQIEIEYLELINKLVILNEKIETTYIIEIKRHIPKLKPKKSTELHWLFRKLLQYLVERMQTSRCLETT
jgi:hypothetical protein